MSRRICRRDPLCPKDNRRRDLEARQPPFNPLVDPSFQLDIDLERDVGVILVTLLPRDLLNDKALRGDSERDVAGSLDEGVLRARLCLDLWSCRIRRVSARTRRRSQQRNTLT